MKEDELKELIDSIYEFIYNTVTSFLKTIIEFINNVAFKEPTPPEAIKTMSNILNVVCASIVVCILLFKIIKNMIEQSTGQSNTSYSEIFVRCIKTYLIILIMPIILSFSMKYIIFPLGNWCFYSIERDFGITNKDCSKVDFDGHLYNKIDDFACTLPFSTINFKADYESFDFDNEVDYTSSYPKLVEYANDVSLIDELFGNDPSESHIAILCKYFHDSGYNDNDLIAVTEYEDQTLSVNGDAISQEEIEQYGTEVNLLLTKEKIQEMQENFDSWCIQNGYCKKTGSGLFVVAIIEAFICFALGAFLFKLCIFYADIVYMGLFSIIVGISACTDNNSYVSIFWKEILSQVITICSQLILMAGFVSIIISNGDVNSALYWSKLMLSIGMLVLMLYQPHILKAVWYDTGAKKSMISFVKTATRKALN